MAGFHFGISFTTRSASFARAGLGERIVFVGRVVAQVCGKDTKKDKP
jgi:hypothetical protein